ncbi:SIR4-interacting protein Sif2p [Trichomonascus vanleenenianus]|uniref:Sif2p n=1 Tax=Trichomonascus vanleenenianus TaxID=2268995 RepID=UPI003ECA211E
MSISSDGLNYLVWRYLQESGFELSAYALDQEARASRVEEELGPKVSMGTLIRLIQKGIELTEFEAQARQEIKQELKGAELAEFTLVRALSIDEQIDAERKQEEAEAAADKQRASLTTTNDEDESDNNNAKNRKSGDVEMMENASTEVKLPGSENGRRKDAAAQVETVKPPVALKPLVPVFESHPATYSQWSPAASNVVAFGDAQLNVSVMSFHSDRPPSVALLHHTALPGVEKEITAISWNSAGTLLVTAAFDGQMRLWTADGRQRHLLSLHKAPVFAVKWNRSGSLILSVDCTNTVAVWDAFSGEVRQTFHHHRSGFENGSSTTTNGGSSNSTTASGKTGVSIGADADWIDGLTYAVTGEGADIVVCKVGEWAPLLKFKGHTQGINSIQFDTATQLLCSGSDDHSVRIWHGKSTSAVAVLSGHTAPVLVTRWLPMTESVASVLDPANPTSKALLASASLDGTVRVWSAQLGVCLTVLSLHRSPVFNCEVSPNGRFLASGSVDGMVVVWDVASFESGQEDLIPSAERAVAQYKITPEMDNAPISSLSWNSDSTKLFASFPVKSVVLDLNSLI